MSVRGKGSLRAQSVSEHELSDFFTLQCLNDEVFNSPEAQQHLAAAGLKEVAEVQQKCIDSVKVEVAGTQERSRTQREDGKQDACNRHA